MPKQMAEKSQYYKIGHQCALKDYGDDDYFWHIRFIHKGNIINCHCYATENLVIVPQDQIDVDDVITHWESDLEFENHHSMSSFPSMLYSIAVSKLPEELQAKIMFELMSAYWSL